MSYTTQEKVETLIPPQYLVDALDDDRDGAADEGLLDTIIEAASNEVDGFLAGRFTIPFEDPAPAAVAEAALVFVCERLYARRLVPDEKNPFTARANAWRERLQKMGDGTLPLDASLTRPNTPGASIVEDVTLDDTLR